MKLFLLCLLLYAAVLGACAQGRAAISATATIPSHPRLLLLAGQEAALRQHLETELPLWQVHKAILTECDKLIALPCLQRVLTGRRLLEISRECLRRELFLSYAWRLTQQEKYRQRAEKELLAVAAFADWNPTHFLDVAEMTAGVALGYDWLYSNLSETSRLTIREAILQKGLRPSLEPQNNGWLRQSTNWNQVCNAGMALGALAIYEDQPLLARTLLNRAIETVTLPMQAYGPDGAYPEGYGYWSYGTSYNVLLINALEQAFGNDFGLATQPGFLKTADYFQNMAGPSGQAFNYSDSSPNGSLQPTMFWFAARLRRPALLWQELKWLQTTNSSSFVRNPLLPMLLLWSSSLALANVVPPGTTANWVGRGANPVALMRTSWTDPGAIYVGLKAGSPGVNHGHMDVGSFVLEADGVRWGLDLGMQAYESLESKGVQIWGKQRWEVFRYTTQAHSTLLINDQPQAVSGYAPIVSSSAEPDFQNAIIDLHQLYPYALQAGQRGIAIVDRRYVVVQDELETGGTAATVRWSMLTAASVKQLNGQEVELSQDGKKLRLLVQAPATIILRTWSTNPPRSYDAPNLGTTLVGFETLVPANTKRTLTVLLLPNGAGLSPITKMRTLAKWPR